ncbi:GNAT family N-acetyltransferase [Paremcibacter congregatus]|uniref:GNAT family N-acetyltransferase n=2 Tax=Paremcibacter congregatus TaxID=2043170 RepID=UPI003A8DAF65|tara:strand:+ start:4664 stop:5500 length:837 start_codon:yes stop_codon:yes gene_type:complete
MAREKINMSGLDKPGAIFVKAGDIEIRLANSEAELLAAQKLRYQVFYKEMHAKPTGEMEKLGRDYDDFDLVCDHLLAFDTSKTGDDAVIATYRLLREEKIDGIQNFYSSQEFDLSNMDKKPFRDRMAGRQGLELGRSCVREAYRSNNIIQLMWKAIIVYITHHKVGCLFGCASLAGVIQGDLELPLSYLYHKYKTPDDINIPALPERFQKMDYYPADYEGLSKAKRQLAPLVRGYAALGCYIGDGAVIDEQFNTTDVFILLFTDRLRERNPQMFDGIE